jgi:hypothetical protein
MPRLWLTTVAVALFAATYVAAVFFVRRGEPGPQDAATIAASREFMRIYGASGVKILQFYARDGDLVEGDKSVLCYGVLNATSVRMEPPVEGLTPSLNRCIEVAPERETRYTLIAEGADGRSVSESFVLGVRTDKAELPKITTFAVAKREQDYTGKWIFSVRFAAQNPEEVTIDPPVFRPLHRSPVGSFYVAPSQTTTYTLTVTNKRGHKTQRRLTIEMPPK